DYCLKRSAEASGLDKSLARTLKTGVTRELDLHNAIMDYCDSKGWIYFHGAMCRRTSRTLGEPDFIIAMDAGKTIYVECKTATGKVTLEQKHIGIRLTSKSHDYYIVRSLDEFLKVVE